MLNIGLSQPHIYIILNLSKNVTIYNFVNQMIGFNEYNANIVLFYVFTISGAYQLRLDFYLCAGPKVIDFSAGGDFKQILMLYVVILFYL